MILTILWNLWPRVPFYGRKALQFVDLLGYLTIKSNLPLLKAKDLAWKTVQVLRGQNQVLSRHPNAVLYATLATLLDCDGFYLESEPCLVCNNPEIPFQNIKLASIKVRLSSQHCCVFEFVRTKLFESVK